MLLVEVARPPGDFGPGAGEIDYMLAGAAAGFDHVTGFAGKEWLQHRPDCPMVAVKRRRIEATVRRDRPAILAEFHDIFSHDILPDFCWRAGLTALNRGGANRKKLDRRQAGSWNLRLFRVRRENTLRSPPRSRRLRCQPMAFML